MSQELMQILQEMYDRGDPAILERSALPRGLLIYRVTFDCLDGPEIRGEGQYVGRFISQIVYDPDMPFENIHVHNKGGMVKWYEKGKCANCRAFSHGGYVLLDALPSILLECRRRQDYRILSTVDEFMTDTRAAIWGAPPFAYKKDMHSCRFRNTAKKENQDGEY